MRLMKDILALQMLAMTTMSEAYPLTKTCLSNEDAEDLRLKRERKEKDSEEERNLAKGLKKFIYGSNVIWAINEKNADRKAKNKGYL